MHPIPGSEESRLRPLRRPDGSVQIGLGPHSLRLSGLSDHELRWLASLDPSRARTEALAAAALEGLDPMRATAVLDRLVAAGLLRPVSITTPHQVAVVGSGELPALLVDILRHSDHLQASRVRPGGEAEAPTDLAIVVSTAPTTPEAVTPWHIAATPVLPLWCMSEQASIGPLLHPGHGPCLTCIDLTRSAVDPGWPWLRAQLTHARVTRPEPVNPRPAIRLLAAGLATTLALDHLADRLTTPEWSFDVAVPGPTLERHHWPRHPGCRRCAPVRLIAAPTTEEGALHPGWGDTMVG